MAHSVGYWDDFSWLGSRSAPNLLRARHTLEKKAVLGGQFALDFAALEGPLQGFLIKNGCFPRVSPSNELQKTLEIA